MFDGKELYDAFCDGLMRLILIVFLTGVSFTLFCIFGVPWLWNLCKPMFRYLGT